jgi:hypothetical protein
VKHSSTVFDDINLNFLSPFHFQAQTISFDYISTSAFTVILLTMLLSYRLFAAFFISSIQLVATSPLPQATATPVYKIEQASAPLVTSAATLEKRAIPVDGRRTETIGYRKVHPVCLVLN